MATVRLTDIIDVTIFDDLPAVPTTTLTLLSESGIIVNSPMLNSYCDNPGNITELPFWNDLDDTNDPNLSTDNPADVATPENVNQGEQIARKLHLNNGWSASRLAADLAMGADAMTHIRSRVDRYWARQFQRRLINLANGVIADNVANDAGDMVSDISIEDGNNAAAGNLFSRTAMTGVAFTLGDHWEMTTAMVVHSVVYKRMVDNDDIDFIPDSRGTMQIPTFLGRRIIVDDNVNVVAGATSGFKYTSYLFGPGAIGYGSGTAPVPTAIQVEEDQGNGAGVETLWSRKKWLMHPGGFQFTSASVAGISPTNAEFANAANWDRVIDRKNIPMAFLITNG